MKNWGIPPTASDKNLGIGKAGYEASNSYLDMVHHYLAGSGEVLRSRAVVITTGTFLRGRITIGMFQNRLLRLVCFRIDF